ncbi:MAG: hypothetical protein JRJ29_10480 [Deltaproteobacteria bacterium]|nr:hypothetical protein [Deltaproteobacteria bacterium]
MKKKWYAAFTIAWPLLMPGLFIGVVDASVLQRVRTGEHGAFTRLVFEFRGLPENAPVESVGQGKLSLLFPNTRTDLPPVVKFSGRKRVDRMKFVSNGSDLTADIFLKLPYFSLKTLRLKDPERVVFDLYWIPMTGKNPYSSAGSKADEQGKDLSVKPLPVLIKGGSKPFAERWPSYSNEISGLGEEAGQSTGGEVQDSRKGMFMSFVRYGFWQTLFLGLLNLLTLILIMMLGFVLSRQIKRVDGQDRQEEHKESLRVREEDRRLMLIDAGIRRRLSNRCMSKAA